MNYTKEKTNRVLDIFFRLFKGENISIKRLAAEYQVSTKSISRDINEIKNYLADNRESVGNTELKYSYQSKSYSLEIDNFLLPKELMAVVKVLIGSRAFSKEEVLVIISKLKTMTSSYDRNRLNKLIKNEMYHYKEVHHDASSVIDNMWKLIRTIDKQVEITVTYYKQNRSKVEVRLKPVAILFSEFYFYLLAYVEEDTSTPHHFRIDRVTNIVEHRKKFNIDHSFDEGLLKEHIQYMYPGVYRKIKFEFTGPSVQAVLDKMPSAKIVEKNGRGYIIEAYVYGRGINMFLLSQGSWVKVLEPKEYVEEIKNEISKMNDYYRDL